MDRVEAMRRVRMIAAAGWRRYRGWPLWAQIVVGLIVISVLASPFTSSEADTKKVSAGKVPVATTNPATTEPTTTEPATTTERPSTTARTTSTTVPPSPTELLRKRVSDALGSSNRKVPRIAEFTAEPGSRVIITWAINDNLTDGLRKDAARLEAMKILKAIREAKPDYDGVFLAGTFPLVDRFGNVAEETVVRGSYTRETVERINFANFNFKNVFEIADSVTIHPAFRY